MALKPESSVIGGLAVAGLVYGIHAQFTPSMADMKGLPAGNQDIDKAERQATWLSAAVVSGVSLLTKDPTIFILGASATVAMAFFTRHAVHTEGSALASLMAPGAAQAASANDLASGPEPVGQSTTYQMFAGQNNEFIQ